jgi:chromosome segregation ATPase
MISTEAVQAASSITTTLQSLENTLEEISSRIKSLEQRGKTHLDSYLKLVGSYKLLQQQRDDLKSKISSYSEKKSSL